MSILCTESYSSEIHTVGDLTNAYTGSSFLPQPAIDTFKIVTSKIYLVNYYSLPMYRATLKKQLFCMYVLPCLNIFNKYISAGTVFRRRNQMILACNQFNFD